MLERAGGQWLWPGTLAVAWFAAGLHLLIGRLLKRRQSGIIELHEAKPTH